MATASSAISEAPRRKYVARAYVPAEHGAIDGTCAKVVHMIRHAQGECLHENDYIICEMRNHAYRTTRRI